VVSWVGLFFLGSAVVNGGEGRVTVCGFFVLLICVGETRWIKIVPFIYLLYIHNGDASTAEPKKNNPTQDTTSLIHRSHTIHSSYLTC